MGRQIAVVMAEKDEHEFLAFLRGTTDIAILSMRAATPAMFSISDLPPRAPSQMQFVIWNKVFPWTPRFKTATDGSCFLENYTSGPVIEYLRDPFSPTASRGRICWHTSPDPVTMQASAPAIVPYCYDHALFRPWYEKIVRWVIRNGTRRGRRGHGRWYLPSAFWRYGWYSF